MLKGIQERFGADQLISSVIRLTENYFLWSSYLQNFPIHILLWHGINSLHKTFDANRLIRFRVRSTDKKPIILGRDFNEYALDIILVDFCCQWHWIMKVARTNYLLSIIYKNVVYQINHFSGTSIRFTIFIWVTWFTTIDSPKKWKFSRELRRKSLRPIEKLRYEINDHNISLFSGKFIIHSK